MKRLTSKAILELFGGAIAIAGATIAALPSSDSSQVSLYVSVACVFFAWAAFTISQISQIKPR
jgi:hypothetical protein